MKINHLPYDLEGTYMIPLDLLSLDIDTAGHFEPMVIKSRWIWSGKTYLGILLMYYG